MIDSAAAYVWSNRGVIYWELGRCDSALPCFDTALSLSPKYSAVLINKAGALIECDQGLNALETIEQAIVALPGQVEPWFVKSSILRKLGDYETSLDAIDSALSLRPKYQMALNNRAALLLLLGRWDDAIIAYQISLKEASSDPQLWGNLVYAYYKAGDFELAVKFSDSALKRDVNSASAWYNKGNAFAKLKEFDSAQTCYDRTLLIRPGYSEAWGNKAGVHFTLKQYDSARVYCDSALRHDPHNTAALGLSAALKQAQPVRSVSRNYTFSHADLRCIGHIITPDQKYRIGYGFAVGDLGHIVTCRHIASGGSGKCWDTLFFESIWDKLRDTLVLVEENQEADLAIFRQVHGNISNTLRLGNIDAIQVGDTLTTLVWKHFDTVNVLYTTMASKETVENSGVQVGYITLPNVGREGT